MRDKSDSVRKAIKDIVKRLMDGLMEKVLHSDPFIPEEHHAKKPLYAALVPDEIFKGSHFERRFTTPFGRVWEKLALVVATKKHGNNCRLGENVEGTIKIERLRRIQEVLNNLEHSVDKKNRVRPNWDDELSHILSGSGDPVPATVTCDLFIDSQTTEKKYAFELKAPLPNSDQTKVSKEKMFKLLAMEPPPVDEVYYALPYNPYGKKKDYVWTYPFRWFDMIHDPSVLIGVEFWDLIGGKGTYEIFISEINLLGEEYRNRIYREYLGMEPPEQSYDHKLK